MDYRLYSPDCCNGNCVCGSVFRDNWRSVCSYLTILASSRLAFICRVACGIFLVDESDCIGGMNDDKMGKSDGIFLDVCYGFAFIESFINATGS